MDAKAQLNRLLSFSITTKNTANEIKTSAVIPQPVFWTFFAFSLAFSKHLKLIQMGPGLWSRIALTISYNVSIWLVGIVPVHRYVFL